MQVAVKNCTDAVVAQLQQSFQSLLIGRNTQINVRTDYIHQAAVSDRPVHSAHLIFCGHGILYCSMLAKECTSTKASEGCNACHSMEDMPFCDTYTKSPKRFACIEQTGLQPSRAQQAPQLHLSSPTLDQECRSESAAGARGCPLRGLVKPLYLEDTARPPRLFGITTTSSAVCDAERPCFCFPDMCSPVSGVSPSSKDVIMMHVRRT